MTARSTPTVRIGDAERAEAQRALQHHLNAGRLQLAEFVDRFGRAAESVTAADVAALFADLPAPHPKLPGAPGERIRHRLVIVGAVAALAFVGSLGCPADHRPRTDHPVPVGRRGPRRPDGPDLECGRRVL
jgi:hypothetical protein